MKSLKFASIILVLFSLMSCKDTEEINPEKNTPLVEWVKLDNVDRRILNTKVINGKLHAVSNVDFYYDLKVNESAEIQSFRDYITRIGRYRAPFNGDLLGTRTESDILIFPSYDISLEKGVRIKGLELDESFKSFEDVPVWRGDMFGISNNGSVLIPYRSVQNGIAENTPHFFLFNAKLENDKIEFSEVLKIKQELFSSYQDCNKILSFDDFFLVQIGNRTFKIDNAGVIEEISTNPVIAFKFSQELRSLELDRVANEFIYKKADSNGMNWQVLGRLPNVPALRNAEFVEIDGRIIGFDGLDIFEVAITNGNSLNINYFQSNKLEGGYITSISKLNENTIIISTNCNAPSTNCGIFSKSVSEFFTPRPN